MTKYFSVSTCISQRWKINVRIIDINIQCCRLLFLISLNFLRYVILHSSFGVLVSCDLVLNNFQDFVMIRHTGHTQHDLNKMSSYSNQNVAKDNTMSDPIAETMLGRCPQ